MQAFLRELYFLPPKKWKGRMEEVRPLHGRPINETLPVIRRIQAIQFCILISGFVTPQELVR